MCRRRCLLRIGLLTDMSRVGGGWWENRPWARAHISRQLLLLLVVLLPLLLLIRWNGEVGMGWKSCLSGPRVTGVTARRRHS